MKKGENGLRRKRFRIKDADYETQDSTVFVSCPFKELYIRIKRKGGFSITNRFLRLLDKGRGKKGLAISVQIRYLDSGFTLNI